MINFFPQFARENLRNFPTVEALGDALIRPHNDVHIAVGGVMNNVTRSPEAPIFWPWHAFIDDIWWEWERCR
ncbi:tyrosinase family protein [Peribacillus frigoritolerans]|uniref:tyrosinase family protein n=1 Tax=Peribacillus frigoritolerans TaxID=450367 RepID=UPI00399CE7A3